MKIHVEDYISKYIRVLQPPYEGVLFEIQEEAIDNDVPIVPHEVARFLSVILTMKKPKRILEIGTAVGFSASLMSKYLDDGGHITTIDRYDIMLADAKKNIARMGIEDKVTILEGDANDILPTLEGPYDVIFMDAGKGQYMNFLPHCLRLMPVGGILIADDILQGGYIAKSRYAVERRQRTIHKRLRNFLWEITHNPILETCLLPVGDGIALCYKKEEYDPSKKGEYDYEY